MNAQNIQLWVAIVGAAVGVIGGLTGLLSLFLQQRWKKVNAASQLTDSAMNLVEGLEGKIASLEAENKTLKEEVERLKERIRELERRNDEGLHHDNE